MTAYHQTKPLSFIAYVAIIGLPIIFLSISIYFVELKLNEEVNHTQIELEGVHELQSLYQQVQILQEIRGLHQLSLGSGIKNEKIEVLYDELTAKLRASIIETHADDFRIKSDLQRVLVTVDALFSEKEADKNQLGRFERYTALISDLHQLMTHVAGVSRISLDSRVNTSYLGDAVVILIPQLTEHLAKIRGLSAYMATSKEAKKYAMFYFRHEVLNFTQTMAKLNHRLDIVSATRERGYLVSASGVNKLSDSASDFVELALSPKSENSSPELLFDSGSELIASLNVLHEYSIVHLFDFLTERKKQEEQFLLVAGVGSVIALLLILISSIFLYRRNRQSFLDVSSMLAKLENSEEEYQAIFETVVDGVVTINSRGIIQSFNPAAEHIFGYSPSEVVGRNISHLMPAPYADEHDSYLSNYQQTSVAKIIGIGREVEGKRKNGTTFHMDLAVSEMRVAGEVLYTGIVRDISERKRIERMKTEFISTVSHELRTPLTSIRGSLGLIYGGVVGELPEKAKEMLAIASKNTERLLLLINDILDLQKIESGKMVFHFTDIDVALFLEQSLLENKGYAEQYGIQLSLSKHVEHAHVYADEHRLMQVMNNLLSNAAKFSSAGAKVEVSLAKGDNGQVRVSVSDSGTGIPEEFHPELFERFTQSDSTDTRKRGGTGLGLAITKLIMERHGGSINFVSREGVGTTFFIDFPELTSNTRAITSSNGSQSSGLNNEAAVLIVEDDPDVAILLQRMLGESGFDSDIASSVAQARGLLARNKHYQLITLDLQLPDEDGLVLLKTIKENEQTCEIPVVVVSVSADEKKQELQGRTIGILDWLSKPIDQQRLISLVEKQVKLNGLPKVLHVEDEYEIHHIVSLMLRDYCDLVWAESLEAAEETLAKESFDLVLLDIGLPDGSGLKLLDLIESQAPQPKVVIFSAQDVDEHISSRVSATLSKELVSNDQLLDSLLRALGRKAN